MTKNLFPAYLKIAGAFSGVGIRRFGVCRFGDLPPLLDCRAVKRLPGDAKSVIVCALPYYPGSHPARNVALYSVCDDYHTAVGELLGKACSVLANTFPGHLFVPFVDISPIREVEAARLAGLGSVGWHGQLIIPEYGAYLFIGCVVTTLEIQPYAAHPRESSCLECGACLEACPTGALSRTGFDREHCRSAITQKKGRLEDWQTEQIRLGGMAWGCDICLEACPLNRNARLSPINELCQNPQAVLTRENLGRLMESKSYGYRGRDVLLRNLEIIGDVSDNKKL